jgi:hypothetical protein
MKSHKKSKINFDKKKGKDFCDILSIEKFSNEEMKNKNIETQASFNLSFEHKNLFLTTEQSKKFYETHKEKETKENLLFNRIFNDIEEAKKYNNLNFYAFTRKNNSIVNRNNKTKIVKELLIKNEKIRAEYEIITLNTIPTLEKRQSKSQEKSRINFFTNKGLVKGFLKDNKHNKYVSELIDGKMKHQNITDLNLKQGIGGKLNIKSNRSSLTEGNNFKKLNKRKVFNNHKLLNDKQSNKFLSQTELNTIENNDNVINIIFNNKKEKQNDSFHSLNKIYKNRKYEEDLSNEVNKIIGKSISKNANLNNLPVINSYRTLSRGISRGDYNENTPMILSTGFLLNKLKNREDKKEKFNKLKNYVFGKEPITSVKDPNNETKTFSNFETTRTSRLGMTMRTNLMKKTKYNEGKANRSRDHKISKFLYRMFENDDVDIIIYGRKKD